MPTSRMLGAPGILLEFQVRSFCQSRGASCSNCAPGNGLHRFARPPRLHSDDGGASGRSPGNTVTEMPHVPAPCRCARTSTRTIATIPRSSPSRCPDFLKHCPRSHFVESCVCSAVRLSYAFLICEVEEALTLVQQRAGRVFGDSSNPLLVSVRSGARASMPGHVSQRSV